MKNILLVIGDAAEVLDTMYPLFRLREAGWQVIVGGPEARIYHLVQHDLVPGWDITVESPGYRLAADISFHDVRPEEYAGIVLTGGRAPEYLRYDADLLRIVRFMDEQGRPIGSVCHGIEILAAAEVVGGRHITTVRKCRLDAEVVGAIFVDAEVVVDGNLVCARTWHDNPAWMREYIKLLNHAAG
jgi:protease I